MNNERLRKHALANCIHQHGISYSKWMYHYPSTPLLLHSHQGAVLTTLAFSLPRSCHC